MGWGGSRGVRGGSGGVGWECGGVGVGVEGVGVGVGVEGAFSVPPKKKLCDVVIVQIS